MNTTPAELAAAMETVREGFSRRNPQYHPACELLARWLAENAGRLRVKTDCEMCGGDGVFGFTECAMCDGNGYSLAPAFPAKEGQK